MYSAISSDKLKLLLLFSVSSEEHEKRFVVIARSRGFVFVAVFGVLSST